MILVKEGLNHDRFHIQSRSKMETEAIMVHTTLRTKIFIVSGCNPPTNTFSREEILELFPIQTPTIVMGDMNSKHRAWNCTKTNTNGNILLNVCMDNNITIAYPPSPTHYPPRGQASTLDVAMYRGCTISIPQAIPALSSDHNPVVYKIRLTPLHTNTKTFYDYRNANWTRYQQLIISKLP
jgi:endonuclease/exonuclease/phosphatase (EEP) superfamily protein YafD